MGEREREDETRAFVCYRVLHATGEFMRALVFLAKSGEDDASGAAGAGAERGVELSELAVAAASSNAKRPGLSASPAGPMPPPVMAVMASASKCVQ